MITIVRSAVAKARDCGYLYASLQVGLRQIRSLSTYRPQRPCLFFPIHSYPQNCNSPSHARWAQVNSITKQAIQKMKHWAPAALMVINQLYGTRRPPPTKFGTLLPDLLVAPW